MIKHELLISIVIASLVGASGQSPASAQASAAATIIGTWKLVSVETIRPNGEALTDWMGNRPAGMIVYLPSGVMAVQIMRDPRPVMAGTDYDVATAAEKVLAIDGYYAYYGTYAVDEEAKTVTHNVQASLRPSEVGIRYQRRFALAGDRLTLTTPPAEESGEVRFNRLVWERMK
jgi:hypothetical protein